MKPIVAIVGRPNVGKSTLFNRLVGRRHAITLDEPGVTRDRQYGNAFWEGRDFRVVDTGGLYPRDAGSVTEGMRRQAEQAIKEASVILLVMDGQTGLLPDEAGIANSLRRSGKPVFYVVNKIDDPRHEDRLSDFYALGENVIGISAEHGYRVNDLLDLVVAQLPPSEDETEEKRAIRVAIIGRPNVGKSSLLNRLLGEERAVVHNEPGTTRDAIDTAVTIDGENFVLIDTAGIRRRALSASKVERYSVINALKAVERADVCLLVLDATEGIHRQDAHVAGAITQAKKGVVILWNKWDAVPRPKREERAFVRDTHDQLKFLTHAHLLFVSAKTGAGCANIWDAVAELHEACGIRVKTSDVNRIFEGLVDAHNPPVYKGKPVKFFYATQTKVRPPTFVAFVNSPEGVHFSFKRYLVNGFREAFGFGGAPIELMFRRKR